MARKFGETAIIFSFKALGYLSLKQLYHLARFFYFFVLMLPLKFKRTIRINLFRCLPHDASTLLNPSIFHTLIRLLEMPFFWFAPISHVQKVTWEILNEDEFKQAYNEGRGVILLVPHLGTWEAVNYYVGLHYSAVSLYKPRKKPYQEALIKIARERFSVQMYPTSISGVKSLFKSLKEGKCVGILPDHDPGDNGGVFVPFFGISANTTTLIAKLADKSASPIYFAIAKRLDRGAGFRLHFVKGNEDIASQDINTATTALNAQIADLVKLFPEQYEWSYKRFRRTPWNNKGFYE